MSDTAIAPPPAPRTRLADQEAVSLVVSPHELAALWKESNAATIVGVAAISARLLSQIDGHLAARPTVQDVCDAVVGVVRTTIQPQLDSLTAGLQAANQQIGVANGQIASLQQSATQLAGDEKTVATRLAHAEDHLRRVQEHQETLLRQQRELRDELLTLVEVEFRERCRALAAQHDEFARRLAVLEVAREAHHDKAEEPQPATAGPRTTRGVSR